MVRFIVNLPTAMIWIYPVRRVSTSRTNGAGGGIVRETSLSESSPFAVYKEVLLFWFLCILAKALDDLFKK